MLKDCGTWGDFEHMTPVGIAIYEDYADALSAFITHNLDVNQDIGFHIRQRAQIIQRAKPACLMVLLCAGLHHKERGLTGLFHAHSHTLAIAAGACGSRVTPTHSETEPLSLKFFARKVIRTQLLAVHQRNLFCTATPQHLPLPKTLCRYIRCGYDIPQ